MWDEYVWVVVAGAFMALFMAFGIGANDVANAFATSVGSKTLTLFQATILAAIFEFSGALLLGRGVTKTVRKGIVDPDLFENEPEILMFGMLCALTAAGIWLIVATYFELPVSTTHSIIGGLVGFALVSKGSDAVIWHDIDNSKDFPIKGISAVVISWIFSPVASGIVAAFFFFVVRAAILRHESSFDRAFLFFPILVLICVFINAFYVLDKGIAKQWDALTTEQSAWIAAIIGVVSCLIAIGVAIWLKGRTTAKLAERAKNAEDAEKGLGKEVEVEKSSSFFTRLQDAINSNDPHAVVDTHQDTKDIHDNAEVFDPNTEFVFRYLQVLTSCADSFAHGANDVANAVGPFAAIYGIYRNAQVSSKTKTEEWILVIGGAGIVLGLSTYGYHIIKAIGVKLTKITPSRGFAIELGSALIVVTGSYLGLPLSTTHCQVGATVAVGLLEGGRGVSWKIVAKSIAGWVFTLIVVGFISALFMSLGIYSPNLRASEAITTIKGSLNDTSRAITTSLEAACPGNAGILTNNEQIDAITDGTADPEITQFPNRLAASLDILTETIESNFGQPQVACIPTPLPERFTALYPVEEEDE